MQAIKESQKGLEQADAVRRITLVGIVFIPLSFATSFFGMNFEQLGTGTLHIAFFVLLAAISGLVAWVLAASIQPAERMWRRAQNKFGERTAGEGTSSEDSGAEASNAEPPSQPTT
ncbi:hypothetical protein S40293_10598 [Stachybotrys chartarum IBT 40293]|nr:hypothetical protein S40293_10598 [Stachybotrys chartarum IBT 40293]